MTRAAILLRGYHVREKNNNRFFPMRRIFIFTDVGMYDFSLTRKKKKKKNSLNAYKASDSVQVRVYIVSYEKGRHGGFFSRMQLKIYLTRNSHIAQTNEQYSLTKQINAHLYSKRIVQC